MANEQTPAAETPPPAAQAIPVVDKPADAPKSAHEKLQERADAAIKAAQTPETPKPVEAKVDMDPETLKKLTEASERARAAGKRADEERRKREEIEASQADVATIRDAQKLFKEGKRVEAMAKLAGVEDPSAEIEALLQAWVAMPAKPGEAKLTPEEVAALQKDVTAVKESEAKRVAAEKAEADKRNAHTFSVMRRDVKNEDGTARYPLASSPDNAETAAVVALEMANKKLLDLGSPTVTRQLAEHLFDLAYAEIEANLAAKVKPTETAPAESSRPAVRAAVVPRAGATPAAAKTYPRTPEGARERLLDNARKAVEAKGGVWQ